jgi:isopentenyldiphosphate isomerase
VGTKIKHVHKEAWFLKKVAMRIQDLELKKWKIHKQPSLKFNVLYRWYEYEICYTISFQFQVKPHANEEEALCMYYFEEKYQVGSK